MWHKGSDLVQPHFTYLNREEVPALAAVKRKLALSCPQKFDFIPVRG